MSLVAVIDIDTTIADCDHRAVHLVKDSTGRIPQPCWDNFLDPDLMKLDTPVPHAREVIDAMRKRWYQIVFLTGRNERFQDVTEQWLRTHMGYCKYDGLIMRPRAMANVPASQYKEQVFLERVGGPTSHPHTYLFFEDDPYVLGMWQKYGLVFKCPEAWEYMNPETLEGNEPSWKR